MMYKKSHLAVATLRSRVPSGTRQLLILSWHHKGNVFI